MLVIVASGCRPHVRRVFPQPPQTHQPVLELWLSKNCNVGDDKGLEREMRRFAVDLTPRFIAAFESGPPQQEKDAAADYARGQLQQTQKRLREGDSLGLSPRQAARVQALNPAESAARAVAEFVLSYRFAALAGLAVVRTPEALARLQREAADPQSPFQNMAAALAKRTKSK